MKETNLVKSIDDVLSHFGFVRKNSEWSLDKGELIAVVSLQKSNFGDGYYVNYGYIIKKLPLDNERLHVMNGLAGQFTAEDSVTSLIENQIVKDFSAVNSEQELLAEIKKRHTTNDISLNVKEYFGLE